MESINAKAARWAIGAVSGSLSPGEQHDLHVWLNADPRHRGAYVRARAQWVDLDRLAALHGPASPFRDEIDAQHVTSERLAIENAEEPPRISRRHLLAASIAATTVAGGGWTCLLFRAGSARYISGVGEVRQIALEDGSTLSLNTATEVNVNFGDRERNIRLIRGEAFAEVAHDKARPFVVVANEAVVRALGTAFTVRLQATQVDVTVTEGVVEVASSGWARSATRRGLPASALGSERVSATERVVIAGERAPQIRAIAPAEAARLLAWREGMVSFDGETLQTAVTEINRHNRRQIVITDPALAARPIVGVFRAGDLDAFSAAAAAALRARAIPDGHTIRLEPDTSQTQK